MALDGGTAQLNLIFGLLCIGAQGLDAQISRLIRTRRPGSEKASDPWGHAGAPPFGHGTAYLFLNGLVFCG